MNPLRILVIDDEQLIRWSFEKQLSAKGFKVFTAETGEEGIRLFGQHFPEIVFVDNRLPNLQGLDVISRIRAASEDAVIVFMTAYGSIDTAVLAMKNGASEYVTKPFSFKEIHVLIDNIREKIRIGNEIQLMKRQQREKITFNHIIGDSPGMKKIVTLARKIARIETTTILLLGESGTGKDYFARAIHNESDRCAKPFVIINCASLPDTLLESELFGHEQGAFTDAKKQKKGFFEMAEGGTVFLDEIGEVSLVTQVKLLNVIENRVVRRLGGTSDIPVDIRIIAATNKNLLKAIENRAFREDLYYRLNVFHIDIPPLREHKEDIPLLTSHFIEFFCSKFRKKEIRFEPGTMELLTSYSWPGNIRELRNVIERAVILETGDTLQDDNLPKEIFYSRAEEQQEPVSPSGKERPIVPAPTEGGTSLYDLEKQTIIRALQQVNYNQTRAAALLKITRDTLRYKMKKYKL
jgi:two-component system, NtrC family, response regulator AtoC